MAQTLTVPIGIDQDWRITCQDDIGSAISFDGTEVLAARCWPGEARATTFAPAVVFLVPGDGTLMLTVAAAQTAALEPGVYRLQVTVTTGGRTFLAFDGSLKLTRSPGAAVAGSTYCTYADLLDVAPWLDRIQGDQNDQEGFVDKRVEARRWFDGLILRAYPGAAGLGPQGAFDQRAYVQGWGGRNLASNRWLLAALAANQLVTTGPVGGEVVKVNALYAVSLVTRGQLSTNGKFSEYQTYGWRCLAEAFGRCNNLTVELDLDADGYGELAIVLGTTNTRLA